MAVPCARIVMRRFGGTLHGFGVEPIGSYLTGFLASELNTVSGARV